MKHKFEMTPYPMAQQEINELTCRGHEVVSILDLAHGTGYLKCMLCGQKQDEVELTPQMVEESLRRIIRK